MKAPPAVAFECRASWMLVAAIVVVALLAIFAVSISGGAHWLRSALIIFICAIGGVALVRPLRPRVRTLLWRADGGVELGLRDTALEDGRPVQAAVQSARVMGPLIVLTLRWPPRERVSLWLLPDNLDADTRRRLRMRLGASGVDASASGNADSG